MEQSDSNVEWPKSTEHKVSKRLKFAKLLAKWLLTAFCVLLTWWLMPELLVLQGSTNIIDDAAFGQLWIKSREFELQIPFAFPASCVILSCVMLTEWFVSQLIGRCHADVKEALHAERTPILPALRKPSDPRTQLRKLSQLL